ncbi:MAG: fluoride efflux transporter CrcB [Bacteroidota bacterium]
MLKNVLIIGLGGFLGTISRYLSTVYVHKWVAISFPLGTFLVNILGCFLIGLFFGISEKSDLMSSDLRIFLTIGFCGGFTTFSTFASDNIMMIKDQQFLYMALYTIGSVALGLLMVYLGQLLIKTI